MKPAFGLLLALAFSAAASAQDGVLSSLSDYFAHWEDRVAAAQSLQPKWMTPLATVTPRLEQEFRYDQGFQSAYHGSSLDLYGSGKGLELIPAQPIELIFTVPAYEVRRGPGAASGFGDWPGILMKIRLLSAPETSGNYVVTLFLQYGLPTGALAFTSRNQVFTPTLAAGKGWGDFDVQATMGDALPTSDHSRAGSSILTNVTLQYHLAAVFWPEVELNRTDWSGGARAGRGQTLLTPGIIFGRFPIRGRAKLIFGAGYQTAVSGRYATPPATPTFDHGWIVTARTAF